MKTSFSYLLSLVSLLPLQLSADSFDRPRLRIEVAPRCSSYFEHIQPALIKQTKTVPRRRGCTLIIHTAEISFFLPVEISLWGTYQNITKEAQLIYKHPSYETFRYKVRLNPRALRTFSASTENALPLQKDPSSFEEVQAKLSRCESDTDCGQTVNFSGCDIAINNQADPSELLAFEDTVQIACVECLLAPPVCHEKQCVQFCQTY